MSARRGVPVPTLGRTALVFGELPTLLRLLDLLGDAWCVQSITVPDVGLAAVTAVLRCQPS